MAKQLTVAERTAILDAEVLKLQKKGWVVQDRTPTTAQLLKPAEKYGGCARLMFGLLLLLAPRKDEYLLLEVTERGKVKRKKMQK